MSEQLQGFHQGPFAALAKGIADDLKRGGFKIEYHAKEGWQVVTDLGRRYPLTGFINSSLCAMIAEFMGISVYDVVKSDQESKAQEEKVWSQEEYVVAYWAFKDDAGVEYWGLIGVTDAGNYTREKAQDPGRECVAVWAEPSRVPYQVKQLPGFKGLLKVTTTMTPIKGSGA